MKVRLLVFLAVWQRPEITEICFQGIERLRKHPDYDIKALAVVSESEMIPLCEKYGVHSVMHSNEPLGQKKNFGLKAAESFDFDYLMEIGSDNLVLNDLLDVYKDGIGLHDFFGVSDLLFVESSTGEGRRVTSKRNHYGAARMMSRAMLEVVGFKVWPDMSSRGLDNASIARMGSAGFFYRHTPMTDKPMVIDLKSEVNIWPFNHSNGVSYDVSTLFHHLSDAEVEGIKQLQYAYARS